MNTRVLPLLIGIFLAAAVYWKYQADIEASKAHYIATSHGDVKDLANRIEGKLSFVHQGLHIIADLPAVHIDSLAGASMDAEMLHIISDIYDSLLKNTGLSKIVILPSHTELNDQHGHDNKAHRPFLVLNPEFHFSMPLEDMSADDYLTTVSIHEQLQFFEENYPGSKHADKIAYQVVTSEGASRTDDPSLIYTLPVYGPDDGLKGVISAIIPVRRFAEILDPSGNILVHKNNRFIIAPPSAGRWKDAMQWVEKAVPHPGLLYSEVLALDIPDLSGEWVLWAARPDAEYWSSREVVSARNFMLVGMAFSTLLAVGLIIFVKMTKYQQRMIKQKNDELEIKVHERTGELREALHAFKKTAKAVVESEEKNRMVVSSAVDGMIVINQMGTIMSFNPAAEKIFGYSADQVVGHKVEILMPEPYHSEHQTYLDNYITTGINKVIGKCAREVTAIRKNGQTFPMELVVSEMILGGKRQFLAIVRDITTRKHIEEVLRKEKEDQQSLIDQLQAAQGQLMQSEKMASIGQLAAGVAHEINNPVGYINSNIGSLEQYIMELFAVLDAYEEADPVLRSDAGMYQRIQAMKERVDLGYLKEDVVQLMKESQEGVKRVRQIVQDLKDFSHIDEAEWQWADLHKGMDSTLNIVHNELKYKAEVVKKYGKIPEIECIPSQINQVFMNLLVNASQAIETRGVITVRTGMEGEEAWIEVSDTGKGIPGENLKRIFDPFFTTKPVGKGTGLGLSLSFGIIKRHHGRIEVESEVGKGTTLRLWLPVKQDNRQEPVSTEKAAGNTPDLVAL